MTLKRIYNLAYMAALENWGRESDYLKEAPDSELNQCREHKAWKELTQIEKIIKGEENPT